MYRKLLVIIAAVFATLLTSCGGNSAFDKIKDEGYNIRVVFDGNGGMFNEESQRFTYVKENSYICEPGENSTILSKVSRDGYTLIGWFIAEGTDEDGNPLKDENGNVLVSDKAWDFKNDIVTTDVTLVAMWEVNYRFVLHYVYQDPITSELTLDLENVKNEVLTTGYLVKDAFGDAEKIALKNTTFLGLYKDEQCTEAIGFDYAHQFNELNPDEDIYVKCYNKKYTYAYDASDFEKMASSSNYILMNDIDFSDADVKLLSTYSGTIIGNGYTMKNLSVKYGDSKSSLNSFGLFGELKNATLTDVNFENCNVTVEFLSFGRPSLMKGVGLLAGNIDGSYIKNVNCINCTVQLIKSALASEINIDAESPFYYKDLSDDSVFENVNGEITYIENIENAQ